MPFDHCAAHTIAVLMCHHGEMSEIMAGRTVKRFDHIGLDVLIFAPPGLPNECRQRFVDVRIAARCRFDGDILASIRKGGCLMAGIVTVNTGAGIEAGYVGERIVPGLRIELRFNDSGVQFIL